MHGNELRKAGRLPAALARLEHALALSHDPGGKGAALALLARAAGEAGRAEQFDTAIEGCHRLLDSGVDSAMLVNRFALREIHARGLLALHRPGQALRITNTGDAEEPAAPQWHVIERVTTAEILATTGDHTGAEKTLHAAITTAEQRRLPHQIQRAIRAAQRGGLTAITTAGHTALQRLRDQLAPATPH